jgi:hypothetical protein
VTRMNRATKMVDGTFGAVPDNAGVVRRERQSATGRLSTRAERSKLGKSTHRGLPWPVFLFMAGLLIPWIITIGPVRMSLYRFVLLACLLPCLIGWISGKAGRIRIADISLILYCFWCFLAIGMVHGFDYAFQPSGMIFIETVGAYMLARCFIRDADDFYNMVRMLLRLVTLLLPFAVFEAITGRNVLLSIFAAVYPTFPDNFVDPRWGMRRVQSLFEHPILYGVVCASALALTHMVLGYGKSFVGRWRGTAIVIAATFFSLSAGPMTALASQGMLLGWNWVLKSIEARWKILCAFGFLAAMSIELLSNRSVPVVFMSYFSFDESSAYVRAEIWRYGSASIMNHPLFGVGFGYWERPSWMSPSIDMFWIIDGVRHGLPAELFMGLAFFAVYLPVAFKSGLDERTQAYKTAFVIAMTGFFLVGWTVYFWNATYVVFIFMLGSGVWILDAKTGAGETMPRGRSRSETVDALRRNGRASERGKPPVHEGKRRPYA